MIGIVIWVVVNVEEGILLNVIYTSEQYDVVLNHKLKAFKFDGSPLILANGCY